MKIKLVDESIHAAIRAEITNGRLEIDFKEKTSEEIQKTFSNPENLEIIETLTDNGEKYGEVTGWTVYGGVMLVGEVKTLILSQQGDPVQERLTSAEAKALKAVALAQNVQENSENIATQITDLQLAVCEIFEGMEV